MCELLLYLPALSAKLLIFNAVFMYRATCTCMEGDYKGRHIVYCEHVHTEDYKYYPSMLHSEHNYHDNIHSVAINV